MRYICLCVDYCNYGLRKRTGTIGETNDRNKNGRQHYDETIICCVDSERKNVLEQRILS